MLAKLRSRLTYANVMATVAVFLALGGSAFAAATLTRNSVRGQHIAPNAISSSDVRNGRLLAADFAKGQLPAGVRGDAGPQGPIGPKGAEGP